MQIPECHSTCTHRRTCVGIQCKRRKMRLETPQKSMSANNEDAAICLPIVCKPICVSCRAAFRSSSDGRSWCTATASRQSQASVCNILQHAATDWAELRVNKRHTHTHTKTIEFISLIGSHRYVKVCVCVCVCLFFHFTH